MSLPKPGNGANKPMNEEYSYPATPGPVEPAADPQNFGDGYGEGETPKTHTGTGMGGS